MAQGTTGGPPPQAVLQQDDFFFCSGAGSVSVMPPVGCCGSAAAARGRRSAMSLNTSATFTFVLALVSQKNRLFSSAYACACPPQCYQMPREGSKTAVVTSKDTKPRLCLLTLSSMHKERLPLVHRCWCGLSASEVACREWGSRYFSACCLRRSSDSSPPWPHLQ